SILTRGGLAGTVGVVVTVVVMTGVIVGVEVRVGGWVPPGPAGSVVHPPRRTINRRSSIKRRDTVFFITAPSFLFL
ncbi:MAG TPA: hypothetical protein PKL26_06530, partial [Methanolinea sp.]|nr:hypothetical protein [Methanolinea sp.]